MPGSWVHYSLSVNIDERLCDSLHGAMVCIVFSEHYSEMEDAGVIVFGPAIHSVARSGNSCGGLYSEEPLVCHSE